MSARRYTACVVSLAALTTAAIGYAIYLSLDPDQYFYYTTQDRSSWAYDPGDVALVCGFMIGEAILAGAALFYRRPTLLWLRCGIALLVLAPWTLYMSQWVVHMPGYFLFHHLWAWLLVALLLGAGAASAMHHAVRAVLRKRNDAV